MNDWDEAVSNLVDEEQLRREKEASEKAAKEAADKEKKTALAELTKIKSEIKALFDKAEMLADKHDFSFSWEAPNGAGYSYTPKPTEVEEDWEASDEDYGWASSSDNC